MSAISYIKSIFKKNSTGRQQALWLSNSVPLFSNFGKDIYASDFVNNAIDRIASEISKIELLSVVERSGVVRAENDDLTRLFRFKPNPLQTTSDFLSNVEWLRRKFCNAFIYPQYEIVQGASGQSYKRFISLYPLNPQAIRIGVNDGQVWEIELGFIDGSVYTLPYAELIHLKWRRGINTVIGGGDDYGLPNNKDLLKTLGTLDKIMQGIPKSIEASLQIKGVYHAKSLVDSAKLSAIRDEFESHLATSSAGIVGTDLAGDFTPVSIKTADIPAGVFEFLKSVICERYGISEKIITGDFTGDQHEAFYQTAIEGFIIQLEQAMTACLFTPRERDVGHRAKAYYSRISYMGTSDKMQLANLAKETGLMTLNQINEMFGIPPFAGGDRRLQSLNYVNIEDIDQYQKNRAGVNATVPSKEDE